MVSTASAGAQEEGINHGFSLWWEFGDALKTGL
jgi:hypothetical protein